MTPSQIKLLADLRSGDLVSRAEVLRVLKRLGDQDADLAMYGAADNARAREYGEAAATRACCAIALMPPASPSPAPAAVEELVARLVKPLEWKFFPQGYPPCWCAQTPFGDCVVEEEAGSDGPSYAARGTRMNVVARTEGLPEAKAAAQADYTARILSALDATDLSASLAEMIEGLVLELRGANETVAAIERAIPDWRSYRDLVDAVECKLAEVRS